MNKKVMLWSVVVGIVLLLSIISVLSAVQQTSSEDEQYDPALNEMVYINSLKGYRNDLTLDQITTIQNTLYGIVYTNEENPKESYTGLIRKDSYKKTTTDTPVYIVSFIADVPDIKKSWKVEYYVNPQGSDGSAPVAISCVNDNERIYDAFECKDVDDQ